MRTRRQYKIAVSGQVADEMVKALGVPEFIGRGRISPIVLVVETDGDIELRNETAWGGHPEGIFVQDEDAYMADVMVEEEGTFPDFQAKEVTGKSWTVYP